MSKSDNGYVYAYRRAWSHPVFNNLREAAIWNFLYQNAFWEDGQRNFNGNVFDLKRGQLVVSISFLAKGFCMSESGVRRVIQKLEKYKMLTTKGANKGTIITVCNYEEFQQNPKTKERAGRQTTGEQVGEQTDDNNKELRNKGIKGINILGAEAPFTKKSKTKKGTRLEKYLENEFDNQDIPQDWGEWAYNEMFIPVETINTEWETFYDYWLSAPGQKGVKLDWLATWRNWIRRVKKDLKRKDELNELYARKR